LGPATGNLMPPTEEVSDALADVVINCPVCPASCTIAEVGRPTAQQAVQSVARLRPWLHVAWHQHVADLRLCPFDTFRRWTCAQVSLAVPLVAMRSERISEKVESLRPGVLHRGLHLVECQPELRHHRLCPRQSLSCISLAEDDEVSRAAGLHRRALSEPYVRLSPHTAPTIQPRPCSRPQWANRPG
jgi:hypothetical protein